MATNIDERVVEMKFDNAQFEKGVKQSMKTLKSLDETIDHMDKNTNLDEMSKNLNKLRFDKLEDSVTSLNKRFSAFGVAGMTVIQDLTHAAENLFHAFGNWLKKPLAIAKSGGWARALNIEDAKFQLKGLGVAWEEVSDDIDYAVSGTAFGLDAAAKAASQLVASGVELGDSMKGALRGISGVAAMTNSAYEEISPIFTTIAGQGQVMTMQLRQLESRGLNAAATLAKAYGVTESELRDMVHDGLVDFDTFAKAMDDAFGEHAKDANATFTGALGNMQYEVGLNPWRWQGDNILTRAQAQTSGTSNGYGLIGWTPARKYQFNNA
ncbi:MAG: tape measure protein, partial [Lachnospiraceae bacterium]|nr:tape measure protein [Lachnospiraceae bacterium]